MNTKEIASMIKEAVEDQVSVARRKAQRYGKKGRDSAVDMRDGVAEMVEDRPIESLLVAAGVGVLIGLLWKMR